MWEHGISSGGLGSVPPLTLKSGMTLDNSIHLFEPCVLYCKMEVIIQSALEGCYED